MRDRILVVTRRAALSAALVLAFGAAGSLYAAGIPRVGKKGSSDNGPYGLPSLKRVTDICSLTHDQEQGELRVYNEYKHREHEEMQLKTAGSSSGLQDCINAVKQLMSPEQQKKFDELLSESKGKKKKT
jgi:hypothetical protein